MKRENSQIEKITLSCVLGNRPPLPLPCKFQNTGSLHNYETLGSHRVSSQESLQASTLFQDIGDDEVWTESTYGSWKQNENKEQDGCEQDKSINQKQMNRSFSVSYVRNGQENGNRIPNENGIYQSSLWLPLLGCELHEQNKNAMLQPNSLYHQFHQEYLSCTI